MLEVVEEGQTEENDVGTGDEKEERTRKKNKTRNKKKILGMLCGAWWKKFRLFGLPCRMIGVVHLLVVVAYFASGDRACYRERR